MLGIEPRVDLEVDEGEHEIYRVHRHWIVLFRRGFIFAVVMLLAAGMAIYRALGGQFFVSGVALEGQSDLLNIALVGLELLLVFLWLRGRNPKQKHFLSMRDLPYLFAIGVVGLSIIFRYRGGRLFHIDPFATPAGGDLLNVALIMLALTMAVILIYNVIDWANDALILTNMRVISYDQQFLVRDVKQQVLIEDIRQVDRRSDTYPAHWFGYGTLVLQSFSPRRLTFSYAANPTEMEQKIVAEVNKIRKEEDAERLRRLIEDRVYDNKPPPQPAPAIHVEEQRGPIPWLFATNPEIHGDTVIWRPFWIFLVLAMFRPLITLGLASVAALLLVRIGLLLSSTALLIWLPLALFCIGWIFWIREEHENDKYILNRQNIIDVDKEPFGPERSRRGPLGAVQDIIFDVGFIENILGYGDVIIDTGAGGRYTFRHVPDPRGVQTTINDYLTDFRKREKERQLQDTLALLRQYHMAQGEHGELISEERLAALIAEQMSAQMAEATPASDSDREEGVRNVVRGELWRMLRLRRIGRRRI
jgi:hypothetical protein